MSAQDNLALGTSVHPWVNDGAQRIRFGIIAAVQSWPEMRDLAQMAEGLGFDSFWRVDHPMLGHDCWTTLAALAAVTRTIRLGTHVSCVAYRPPVCGFVDFPIPSFRQRCARHSGRATFASDQSACTHRPDHSCLVAKGLVKVSPEFTWMKNGLCAEVASPRASSGSSPTCTEVGVRGVADDRTSSAWYGQSI